MSGGDANDLVIFPGSFSTIFAGTDRGVFKSVDGGATWVLKPLSGVRTIAIDPVTPSKLYAGTVSGLSISSNGGDSWTSVPIPPIPGGIIGTIEAIAVDPVTPSTVYAGPIRGIYKSVNGGATWTFAGNGIPTIGITRITRIAISPSNPGTPCASPAANAPGDAPRL